METQQIAVVTIPVSEWNDLKAMIKKTAEQVRALTSKEQKELMTAGEVCEFLKISRSTYERYVNDGVIEVSKVNKKKYSKNYTKRSHLEDLIQNGKL